MVEIARFDRGKGVVRGDDFSARRWVPGIPASRTVDEAWLTVKSSKSHADAAAIFQKLITTSPNVGVGQIENQGAKGTALLRFDISAANTGALTAGALYYFDIQVRLDTNNIYTIESGEFGDVVEEITRDS